MIPFSAIGTFASSKSSSKSIETMSSVIASTWPIDWPTLLPLSSFNTLVMLEAAANIAEKSTPSGPVTPVKSPVWMSVARRKGPRPA
jgi:hypothetical protein